MNDDQGVAGEARTEDAVAFLRAQNPSGPWHLCSIAPDGPLTARKFFSDQVQELERFINERQGRDNVYFHINPLKDDVANVKASKSNVAAATFTHVDIDDPDGLERLAAFRLRPTAVVASGGGYNAYWRLIEPTENTEQVENVNRWLVKELKGDRAATDVSRILRLPGTINIPTKKKREKGRTPCLAFLVAEQTDWSRGYHLSDFGQVPGDERLDLEQAAPEQIATCELPHNIAERLRKLAEIGDDGDQPRSSPRPRYRSRSEAIWALACGLARAGANVETIAGVLLNPRYRISESILEKNKPASEALRQAKKAILAVGDSWPHGRDKAIPRKTFQNTQAAILKLGATCWFDTFRHRMFVEGIQIQAFQGELNDRACTHMRDLIDKRFGFDPGKDMTRDAIEQLCNQSIVDPVCEYLQALRWDGRPRVDSWLIDFAGAEDTAFVRSLSAIMLIAAVRRARRPGTKFDTILVLEGPQGTGKSTLIKTMAGEDFFSDQDILALDNRAQMEALEGVWLFELSELTGMRYTDVTKIKAFLSRAVDRGRPAYGRFSEARPRRCIFIGTTNKDDYLKDATGNRRFWPVRTGEIDLKGLSMARDQLWAEAATREQRGESIVLPRELWSFAEAEQQKRVEADGWEPILADLTGIAFGGRELVASATIMDTHLSISHAHIQSYHWRRLSKAMQALGWTGPMTLTFPDGKKAKGYCRPTDRKDERFHHMP